MLRRLALLLCLFMLAPERSRAHVGAPDVYVKVNAGPYALLVSVHPPTAIPGAAGIDIRTDNAAVSAIAVSLPNQPAQALQRFSSEQIFNGSVWVASAGAWRLVLHVTGSKGEAEAAIAIPATSSAAGRTPPADLWLPGLAALLCAALLLRRRTRLPALVGVLAFAAILLVILLRSRAVSTATMELTLPPGGRLQITLPGNASGLIPDHNHLMHLFALRQPQMDVLLHLHPVQTGPNRFEAALPAMAGGAFTLFADVVTGDGALKTYTATAGLPAQTGSILQGDDSLGIIPGLSRAAPDASEIRLPDGFRMLFDRPAALHPKTGQLLRFTLLDPAGNPPADMQLYMGMAAHAAVFKDDGTVFAHIHPGGTIPMGMVMPDAPTNQVAFPFGFPAPGAYRIFVQMRHGAILETGAFDLYVSP